MDVVWKDIPHYSRYEASSTGLIRRKANLKLMAVRENPSSKGTYLVSAVHDDTGKRVHEGVHRLVCLAFHGVHPDYPKIDVNHIDTDKHNNNESNVEWATRAANVLHSFEFGDRTDARRVIVTDHIDGGQQTFHSVVALARWLQLPRADGLRLVMRCHTERYLDRYTFEFKGSHTPAKKSNIRAVYALNHVNKKFYRFVNLTELELSIGINRGTVISMLVSGKPRLINGVQIWYTDDPRPSAPPTPEQIEFSLKDYAKRQASHALRMSRIACTPQTPQALSA